MLITVIGGWFNSFANRGIEIGKPLPWHNCLPTGEKLDVYGLAISYIACTAEIMGDSSWLLRVEAKHCLDDFQNAITHVVVLSLVFRGS